VRPLSVAILASLTALAVIAAAIVVATEPRSALAPASAKLVFAELAARAGAVARIEVTAAGRSFAVVDRGEGLWAVAEKDDFPANAETVRTTILGLGSLRYREAKTRLPRFYPRLEVEDPEAPEARSARIVVKDAEGSPLAAAIVGKLRRSLVGYGSDSTYVRLPGEAQAWLAEGRVEIGKSFRDWVDPVIIDLDMDKVRDITVRQPDGAALTAFRPDAGSDEYQVKDQAPPTGRDFDGAEVRFLSTGLSYLELDDVAAAEGFDFPEPHHVAELTQFDGLHVEAKSIEHEGGVWVRLRAWAEGEGEAKAWARAFNERVSPWVYKVPEFKANKLRARREDLLAPPEAETAPPEGG